MSERLMREGLRHDWSWSSDDGKFFQAIDATGGWPVGYQFVGFEHTEARSAGFTNSSVNTGWWTVVASADDYYLWKLSPAAFKRLIEGVTAASRVQFYPGLLHIKNSCGHKAALQRAEAKS